MRVFISPLLMLVAFVCLGSTNSATALEANWAEKMFDTNKIEFGVIARGADAIYRVKIKNIYKETVHISDVRTTCGCSAAKPTATTLQSLETAYVEVKMDTNRFMRDKNSNVIVSFDQPGIAQVRIPIHAYIRTDVVISPGAAKFGQITKGTSAQRTLNIAYAGRSNWIIEEVRSDNAYLETHLVEKSRTANRVNYDLMVSIKADAPVGPIRDQLILVTNDANSPRVPLLVEADIESDITVTTPVVALGQLIPGQSKPFNVVLRGKKPFTIEKIEVESGMQAFKTRLPKTTRAVHVLPITMTTPEKPVGNFTETFTLTITGRTEPITFKAYGEIQPDK